MITGKIGPNPFTPRSGQEPKAFAGRDKELLIFKKSLESATQKKFNHFVILGNWGTGKTTLLKEFRKHAQLHRIVSSFVSVHEFTNNDLLAPVVHLLTQISRNLPIKYEYVKNFSKRMQGIGITLPIVGGGFEIGEKKKFDGDSQSLLIQGLLELWKSIKEKGTVVIFLDDVQNYSAVPEFMSVLKNVLSDEDICAKTSFLFVLAVTEEGWAQFLIKYHPIGRYFIPILRLASFSLEQSISIVKKSLEGSGIIFSKEVINSVFEYTEGHPYLLQIFCLYLYENQINGEVNIEQLNTSLAQTLDELGPIILDPLFFLASEQEKEVVKLLSRSYKIYSFDDILKLVKVIKINKGSLSTILARLAEKGLLMKVERGKYRIINKLFNEYLDRR